MKKYQRCLWIISILNEYGALTLKELNDYFSNYTQNDTGETISERTFSRDKEYIASTFQLDIEYDWHIKKYKLLNSDELNDNKLYSYLLSSIHVNNLSSLAIQYRDKIMLDDLPTGVAWLQTILDAISKKKSLKFDYHSYYSLDTPFHYEVIPCFVRMFEHRWYLICEYLDHSQSRVLALERMDNLEIGELKCEPNPEITPYDFYKGCFGIIKDDKEVKDIQLKVYKNQVYYIRSLPLHASQKEIEKGDDYAVFQYSVRPSFDFVQKILMQGENVEVLKPEEFRKEIKDKLKKMQDLYSK